MFGRRRHAAAPAAPSAVVVPTPAPLPRLAEEQIFELVHTRIAAAIGEGGDWVVRRRTDDDTDDIFRSVLAHQVAIDVTAALRSAQSQLEAGEPITVSLATGPIPIVAGTSLAGAAAAVPANVETAAPVEAAEGEPELTPVAVMETPEAAAAPEQTSEAEHVPTHRHDEPAVDDEAELDEDAVALQWEPAPITVWTDLKRPVTGPIALENLKRDLVA
ncbi:hypothetical protein GCM10027568_12670 [Humibacter soli]